MFSFGAVERPDMMPLQTFIDPTMAVVVLGVLLSTVVPFIFLWVFKKIKKPPETGTEAEADDEGPDRGTVGP
jgi:phosphotransferase system  glucose/maltose/N-acetylglucosamine-specific IIC component